MGPAKNFKCEAKEACPSTIPSDTGRDAPDGCGPPPVLVQATVSVQSHVVLRVAAANGSLVATLKMRKIEGLTGEMY